MGQKFKRVEVAFIVRKHIWVASRCLGKMAGKVFADMITFFRNLSLVAALLCPLGVHAQDFAEKQLWSYKTRPGEETSLVLINKVEQDPKLGQIFHISLSNLRLKNAKATTRINESLPHLSVSRATLEKSVVDLKGSSEPNPEYLEGYKIWKEAFDQGKAEVFTRPIAEIVTVIEIITVIEMMPCCPPKSHGSSHPKSGR